MNEYQQSGPPAAGGPAHNGFYLDGVVVRDAHNDERFAGFTVREGDKLYWDVVTWADCPGIAVARALKGGDLVHVEGRLAKRKSKKTNEWEISLVAEKFGVVQRPASAPEPAPAQYQQPQQQQPRYPSEAFRGFTEGTDGRYQQAQRGGQHPDAADWNQQAQGPTWGRR